MFRIAKLILATLFVSFLFNSCTKEYSLESGGTPSGGGGSNSGTSVYTYGGAPGVCSTPVIAGIYQTGVALDFTNTVILTVNVSQIGTYTISTGSANGIAFSASGAFTMTGTQVLILTGSGTPLSAGNNTFVPGASGGCSFQVTTVSAPPTPPAVGTLNCATATFAGIYTQSIALTTANTVTIPVNVTTAGTYTVTSIGNGITFSGSGTLALGAQSIVLTGNGTATNAGATSFTVALGSSNCNFSITFLPAPPPAVGTLNCAGAVIAGVYNQSGPLTTANTVTIPVTVSSAGLYNISVTANGVTFSGSGLLAVGAQNIVLTGAGTPSNSGVVSFPIALGASTCSFSVTFGVSSTDYFRVKIDGVLKTFNVNLLADNSPLLLPNSIAVSGDFATGSDEHLDVTVQSISAITAGTYLQPFGISFATSRYYDPVTGQGYQAGTASSPPLKVVITAISSTRVTGTFSGQYFDLNGTGTNAKQFTSGEFSVPIP